MAVIKSILHLTDLDHILKKLLVQVSLNSKLKWRSYGKNNKNGPGKE